MRWILILGLALAGCQTVEEKAREAAEQRQSEYHRKCVSYGFARGTPDYGRCRQEFDIAEQNARTAKRAVILQRMLGR